MKTPAPSPTRREFLAAATTAVLATSLTLEARGADAAAAFTLPALPYAEDALEPHIDAMTMGIHHGKHHAGYVSKLNDAVSATPALAGKSLDALIGGIPFLPETSQTAVRNNGGGHWNHSLFWEIMGKPGTAGVGGAPAGDLAAAIDKAFGSFAKLQEAFASAAAKRFGSGWAWLIVREDGGLAVVSTPNQDNPLMQGIVPNTDRGVPVLGLDVWEHAYYLHYQNKRPDYISAWWNVVNWNGVAARYAAAVKK